jgi:hypothetical protein
VTPASTATAAEDSANVASAATPAALYPFSAYAATSALAPAASTVDITARAGTMTGPLWNESPTTPLAASATTANDTSSAATAATPSVAGAGPTVQ